MNKWEWIKIVASTLAGMFAAILAEPLKQNIMIKVKQKRIHKALVKELLEYRGTMVWIQHKLDEHRGTDSDQGIRKSMLEVFLDEPMAAYDHYYEKEKDALFTVERWGSFVNAYRYLQRNRNRVVQDAGQLYDAAGSSINITDGELTRRGFKSVKDYSFRKKDKVIQ